MKIAFVPDTQIAPGVPLEHLEAYGNYIVDKKPEVIVQIGDWWDFKSLSQHESPGSKATEGARYRDDVEAGLIGMETFLKPINSYNANRIRNKKRTYRPRLVFTMGNHEHRITRAIERDPRHFEGTISLDDLKLESFGWEVYQFLDIATIEGIMFSHYFQNPLSLTKNVIGGSMDNKLQKLGKSFCMGHQQTLQYGVIYRPDGSRIQGLICGAFYQHSESYMMRQGNMSHWRGAAFLNDVKDGTYDIMTLSLEYLLKKWL